jgi:UDP-glucose 4-epimerase
MRPTFITKPQSFRAAEICISPRRIHAATEPVSFATMTRILVTGGAGYVGSVSVEALLAAGHDVIVLDDLSTGHTAAVPRGAKLIAGDYGDHPLMTILLADQAIEAILHCGARSLVGESLKDPARYFRDNVSGGIALLEAARQVGVRRFVLSSTAAVYGVPTSTPIPEDAELRPINPYGETKRSLEAALAWYGRAYGLRSVSLRYFNVAGATDALGEDHDPETHLIPAILAAVEAGRPMTLFGDDYPTPDGTCIRDYIHVADLADAHLRALEATAPDDATGLTADDPTLVCNLGNGDGFSNLEVIRAAERVIGRPIDYEVGPRRPGDPPLLVASAERAWERLGWRPARPSLDEMIGSAWAWRTAHPGGYPD